MQRLKISQALVLDVLLGLAGVSWSQQVPVSIIVSVEAKHGKEVPTVYKEDLRVLHDHDRLQVTEWAPCQGAQAGLDLFVLMDDVTDPDIGLQFEDARKFIEAQPSDAAIGVGYARNGTVQIVQNLSKDHALAAKALRLPVGSGALASPYLSVTELIKGWPQSANRREILMISSGIDFLQGGPNDSYLQEAIDQAQRAAVQVYAIYASSVGHAGHSYWRITWGQNNLARLTEETGGEFYIQGLSSPIAFAPYLAQFADRLKHQYKLTFLANAGHKAGYQHIKLETEVTNAELVAQENVYVPAAK